MTKSSLRMIDKHGSELCERAYYLNHVDGEGCSTIGTYLGVHWKTADALVNAGREIVARKVEIADLGVQIDRYVARLAIVDTVASRALADIAIRAKNDATGSIPELKKVLAWLGSVQMGWIV